MQQNTRFSCREVVNKNERYHIGKKENYQSRLYTKGSYSLTDKYSSRRRILRKKPTSVIYCSNCAERINLLFQNTLDGNIRTQAINFEKFH